MTSSPVANGRLPPPQDGTQGVASRGPAAPNPPGAILRAAGTKPPNEHFRGLPEKSEGFFFFYLDTVIS